MTLALLCQFTAQNVSDVNTSIFRSLRLLGALLCGLYCAVMIPHHQQPIPLQNTNTSQVRYVQLKHIVINTDA